MAGNNSEFKIFLGLELQKNAETTLTKAIDDLTKKDINLKVGLDESSLKTLTSAINGITQQLQKMSVLTSNVGKTSSNAFKESANSVSAFQQNLRKVTEEYKSGKKTAEEYAKYVQGVMFNNDGNMTGHALKMDKTELESYFKLINQIQSVKPIGELVSTKSISMVTDSGVELVKTIDTYKGKVGETQTIVSHMNKETGTLIASQLTLTQNEEQRANALEKQNVSLEKQKTSLEKYKQQVKEINQFGIDMIKSGNATNADNDMIKNANEIKKEYEALIKLNQENVVIDDLRIQKFKTLLAEQSNLIKSKDTEISKAKELEQAQYNQAKLASQLQASFDKQNTSYSTGVNEDDRKAMQGLIEEYSKLNPLQENFKRKTDELSEALTTYNQKVKETATNEQKQQVAKEKHSIAIQKLENAFKNTNSKYGLGVDNLKNDGMKAQIEMLRELDPLADGYAQDLERIRMNMAQYTVETRENANAVNSQFSNLAKLKSLQESLNTTKTKTDGYYDASQADSLQESLNQMGQMIASGQDVSNMLKLIGADVSKFGKNSTTAMSQSAKALKEEQQLYVYKEKMLVKLNLLEQKYSSKRMNVAPIQEAKAEVTALTLKTDDLKNKMVELDVSFSKLSGAYQMKKIGTSMKGVLGMATGFYGLYSLFGYLREGFSSVIREVTALDDAMIGLSRVTEETQKTYNTFKQVAFETADEIGGTAKEIVDSASEFAKLGYEFSEATKLATSATKYATVGEIALTEATDALSASYTVFGGTLDETMGKVVDSTAIIDLYNKIGNTMAVTSGDIGEAMKASANSLSVANNSLSESVALIATANKTVQDSSKVGNALRTISMRIRGVDEDTGQLLPKMQELISTATNGKVNIMDGEDFKSTYQIMLEISEVWDELTDKQQAYLGESVAGKNRAEVFMALMNNAEDLTYAMQMAEDSIGSVDEEMAIVMQSFEKRVEVMKNAWASVASTTLSSDFVKGFVDFTTAILKLTDACGGLVPVVISLGVAIAVFKFAPLQAVVGKLASALAGLIPMIGSTTTAMTALNTVMSFSVAGVAIAGIMGIAGALNYASKEGERLQKSVRDTQDRISELTQEITGLNKITNKTDSQEERLRALNEELVIREKILKAQQQESIQHDAGNAVFIDGKLEKSNKYGGMDESFNQGELGDVAKAVLQYQDLQSEMEKLKNKQKDLSENDEEYLKIQDKINSKINESREIRQTLSSTLGELKTNYDLLSDSQKEDYDALVALSEGIVKTIDEMTGDLDMSSIINKNRSALRDMIRREDIGAIVDYEAEATKLGVSANELELALSDLRKEMEEKKPKFGIEEVDTSQFSILDEQFRNAGKSSDLLQVSLAELNKEQGLSEETIQKLVDKYPDLVGKIKDVESAYQALTEKVMEQKFDEATDDIASLVGILEDLEAGNGITASSFKKLSNEFPELLAYMNDEASLADAIQSKMGQLKDKQAEAYRQMLLNSEEYFRANVAGNEQMTNSIAKGIEGLFNNLKTAYNGDLKNWESLAKGKADIETQLINSLNEAWEEHFGTLRTQFSKMSTNSIVEKGTFDREKFIADYNQENPITNFGEAERQAEFAQKIFDSQEKAWTQEQIKRQQKMQEVANLFNDIEFDPIDIKVGGTKNASKDKKGSGAKASYVGSIFKEIVDEILKGGEEIERSMEEVDVKLQNAVLIGDEATEQQLLAKMSNLQVALRDKQASMAQELDKQIAEMGTVLSKTGAFKAYDIAKLTAKDMAKVVQDIEKQINSATLSENSGEVDRLNNLKSLITDVGGVYLDTISQRRDLSKVWWEEENNRLQKYAENLDRYYNKKIDAIDREDKVLQLRKSMLLEDSGEYDKEVKEADKIFAINKELLDNIVKKRTLVEGQIALLRAKRYDEESEEILALKDKWLDYEQSRLDMIKEIAEARRQAQIDGRQNELDDVTKNKDYIKSILDLTVDMLKQETEAKKEALNEQFDNKKEALEKEYDAEKEALQDKLSLLKKEADAKKSALDKEKSDRDYGDKVDKKQKEIAKIRQKILELSNDDSISSVKKRKELEAELDEHLKELEDMQYDRSHDLQKEAIDEELKAQEDKIQEELDRLEDQYNKEKELLEKKHDEQIKEYDEYLKNQAQLKEEASKLIESKDKEFYERLKAYSLEYTDTTKAEFQNLWNSAYEALDKYGNKQLSVIDIIEQMTERVIDLNAELEKLNDSSYKDFIEDEDYEYAGDKGSSGNGSGSGNSSSDSGGKEDPKNKERQRIINTLEKMIENSEDWKDASPDERKKLEKENEKLGSSIGAKKNSSTGTWSIIVDKKTYTNLRDAIRAHERLMTRHTGLETGEVGAPWGSFKVKSNEELNKLKDGEIVLNGGQTEKIMNNVKTLAEGAVGGGASIVIDMHDFNITEDSLPNFEKLLKDRIPKIINDTIFSKGVKR